MEHIAVSGRVNINKSEQGLLEEALKKVAKFEVMEGYLNHKIFIPENKTYVELEVLADCVIKNSNEFRAFLEVINELLALESSIKVEQDQSSDPWSTEVVLKNKPCKTVEFKTYLPNNIVL